ncbi:MAG: P-loop NTPase fold protein [Pseudomonadota bacterium]
MKISNDDVVIEAATPFENALPGREAFGEKVSELFDELEGASVIALDGEWGTGKSTFLKMWVEAHRSKIAAKGRVIYFDAFEHEFLDDPLASLVARLDLEIGATPQGKMRKLTHAATKLLGPAARVGLAAASGGLSEFVGQPLTKAADKTTELVDAELDAIWGATKSRIEAVEDFRLSLTAIANSAEGNKGKLIFVIDELDRCRPDYALQFLEVIKHFFAVSNVHFLLGVNLRSLRVSVEARYGQGTGADEYLRKFIHLTKALPDVVDGFAGVTSSGAYCEILCEQMRLPEHLKGEIKRQLSIISVHREVGLRDVEQIVHKAQLLPADFEHFPWGVREMLVTMVLMFCLERDLFKKVLKGSIALEEVMQFLKGGINSAEYSSQDRRWIDRALRCWEIALMDQDEKLEPGGQARVRELAVSLEGAFGPFIGHVDAVRFNIRKLAHDHIENWDTRPFEQ